MLPAVPTLTRRIDHFYGLVPRWLGLSEGDFIRANSRPSQAWHECLRRLRQRDGVPSRIHLYSEVGPARTVVEEGLEWRLTPASFGSLYGRPPFDRVFRVAERQFSMPFLRALVDDLPGLFVFYGNVPTPFACRIADLLVARGVPYAVTLHGRLADALGEVQPAGAAGPLGRLYARRRAGDARRLFSGAGALIVLTDVDRAAAVSRGFATAERVHVIPSAVNPAYFHDGPGERGAFPSLLFVGRLEEAKGFREACTTLAAVRREHPGARLHVAGGWMSETYRREVMDGLAATGATDAVEFHGWLGPEALGDLMRRCHLMLFPSHGEGYGRVVVEAMSCGVAVAGVAGTGGVIETLAHGVEAVRVGRTAWADAVLAALRDREALARMSRAAAQRAARDYALEPMAERVRSLYLGLLGSATSG
jgi:glycosyltransferase involved in cell wall biosynthesis